MKTRSSIIAVLAPPPWWPPAAAAHPTRRAAATPPRRPATARRARCRSSRTRPRRSSTTRSSPPSRRPPRARGSAFKTSFGASGDQSRAVEAGQKADVVTFSTEPDMTRLVDAGLVEPTWKDGAERGPRDHLGRLVRRPQGQPEEHQDLGRPAQAGRRGAHAEPVQLGRGEVEPARRLRLRVRRRQEPGGGPRLPPQAHHRAREGPGQVRP